MQHIFFSKAILYKLSKALQRSLQLSNLVYYRTIHALIWYGKGESVFRIAELLQVTVKTIYNWVNDFLCKGFSWLFSKRYKGRGVTSKLNEAQKKQLYDLILSGPEACGFHCGIWNSALIAELILLRFGVKYNPRYLCRLLKKLGLSYQKAKFISDKLDDEEHNKARDKWLKKTWPQILLDAQKQNAVILFGDEVSFAMWGSLARTWGARGEQPTIKTKGIRKGLKMYGAIEFEGGGFQYMESFHYCLTPKSFRELKREGLPSELTEKLKSLKNENYSTEENFLQAIEELIGKDDRLSYQEKFLKHTQISGKFNSEGYIEFLEQLLKHFGKHVILIEDGAPYHTSGLVNQFVEKQSQLTIHRLPSFSPDYNPIEKLWKNTKRDATHLKYFKAFDELRLSVVKTFKEYLHNATKIICVMKKLRFDAGFDNIQEILKKKTCSYV